jgi:hypothetical protein
VRDSDSVDFFVAAAVFDEAKVLDIALVDKSDLPIVVSGGDNADGNVLGDVLANLEVFYTVVREKKTPTAGAVAIPVNEKEGKFALDLHLDENVGMFYVDFFVTMLGSKSLPFDFIMPEIKVRMEEATHGNLLHLNLVRSASVHIKRCLYVCSFVHGNTSIVTLRVLTFRPRISPQQRNDWLKAGVDALHALRFSLEPNQVENLGPVSTYCE